MGPEAPENLPQRQEPEQGRGQEGRPPRQPGQERGQAQQAQQALRERGQAQVLPTRRESWEQEVGQRGHGARDPAPKPGHRKN